METLEQFIEKKKVNRNQQGDLSGTLVGAPIESAPINIDVPYTPPSKPEPRKNIVDPSYKWANQNSLVDREQPVQDVVPTQMAAPVQPMSLAQMPAQEPETAVSEVRAGDGISPMADLLVGATPALMGVLFGDSELGFGLGAGYLNRRAQERQSLDDSLKQMQIKRRTASDYKGRRFQTKNVVDPTTGKTVVARFDQIDGTLSLPDGSVLNSNDIEVGGTLSPFEADRRRELQKQKEMEVGDLFNRGWKINPTTGELESPQQQKISTGIAQQDPRRTTKKQEQDLKDAVKEFTGAVPYKDSVNNLNLVPTVNGLLDAAGRKNDPNAIAGNSVVLTMIRQAQRVGVASDRDAAAMGGSQAYDAALDRLIQKFTTTGVPVTKRDIADLREISNIYEKQAKRVLSNFYNQSAQAYSERTGVPVSKVFKQLSPSVDPYLNTPTARGKTAPLQVTYKGKTYDSPSREQNVAVEMGGRVVFTTEELWKANKDKYPNAKRIK